jgi:hypothetical protein
MKISELIEILAARKIMHGDIDVIDSLSYARSPDPAARERGGKTVLVLNS